MHTRIFGIGETVLDLVIKNNNPLALKTGGSVLNALVSLARCKHDVYLITDIGKDKAGDLAIDFLNKNHVQTQFINRFEKGQTPLAMAFLNEDNDASYEFYKKYPKNRELLMPVGFNKNDIVLFGSFFSINPEIRDQVVQIVENAKKAGAYIVYDPNFRKSHQKNDDIVKAVKTNMKLANIIRASNEDILNIFDLHAPDEVKLKLSQYCSNIIITSNSDGVDLFAPHFNNHFPVHGITPLSTIGAGDNFNAGIIHALISNGLIHQHLTPDNWQKIIESGIRFSAEVCMSYDNYVSDEFANSLIKSRND